MQPESSAIQILPQRLITVSEYDQMALHGIIGDDERVELLCGKIIPMGPIGKRHALCVNQFAQVLLPILGTQASLTIQNPIQIDDYTEPEPDLALIQAPLTRYADHHPRPEEVYLVIEVADTTLQKDRMVKLPLYAKAGIPECWIVNLEGEAIEAYREPEADSYLYKQTLRARQALALPSGLGDIPVSEVLVG